MEKQSETFTQEKPVPTSANKEQFFSFFARPRLRFTGVFTSVGQKKNLSPKLSLLRVILVDNMTALEIRSVIGLDWNLSGPCTEERGVKNSGMALCELHR